MFPSVKSALRLSHFIISPLIVVPGAVPGRVSGGAESPVVYAVHRK